MGPDRKYCVTLIISMAVAGMLWFTFLYTWNIHWQRPLMQQMVEDELALLTEDPEELKEEIEVKKKRVEKLESEKSALDRELVDKRKELGRLRKEIESCTCE